MAYPTIIEIDEKRFYSEVAVRKLLKKSAASVRKIAGAEGWDFYKKSSKSVLYYSCEDVDRFSAGIVARKKEMSIDDQRSQEDNLSQLFDEFTASLDADRRDQLAAILSELVKRLESHQS